MKVRSNADPASPERGTTFTLNIPLSTAPAGEGRKPVQLASVPAGHPQAADAEPASAVAAGMEGMERKGIA